MHGMLGHCITILYIELSDQKVFSFTGSTAHIAYKHSSSWLIDVTDITIYTLQMYINKIFMAFM